MTKTHVHVPSGKHDYKFKVEERLVWNEAKTGASRFFFVVEEKERFELAPWFKRAATADEMAEKASSGDQFCNAIPCVPYETPIPRPEGSWFRPQEYSERKG